MIIARGLQEELIKEDEEEVTPKDVAKAVDNADKQLDDPDVYVGDGSIERALDRALRVNEREIRTGGHNWQNVLFVGIGGTGKTSRIFAWAQKHGIRVMHVLASMMDDTDIGGVIAGNVEKKVAQRLATQEFDDLDVLYDNMPKTILFLDEYNRAPHTVRGTLLTLIQDHTIPDSRVPGNRRFLKGFLFTVAAINPADANYNTDELDDAEISRFRRVNVATEMRLTLEYIRFTWNKAISKAKDPQDIKELKGQLAIAEALLSDDDFTFDTAEDVTQSHKAEREGKGNGLILTNRTFTNLLSSCDGTKEDFLNMWDDFCNSLKRPDAEKALQNYKDVDDQANKVLADVDTDSKVFSDTQDVVSKMRKMLNMGGN